MRQIRPWCRRRLRPVRGGSEERLFHARRSARDRVHWMRRREQRLVSMLHPRGEVNRWAARSARRRDARAAPRSDCATIATIATVATIATIAALGVRKHAVRCRIWRDDVLRWVLISTDVRSCAPTRSLAHSLTRAPFVRQGPALSATRLTRRASQAAVCMPAARASGARIADATAVSRIRRPARTRVRHRCPPSPRRRRLPSRPRAASAIRAPRAVRRCLRAPIR